MKYRNMAVFTLLLLAAVVLAFGACSSSSDPTGTSSKGLAFEVDENGNNSHPDDWEDLHQSWDSGDAPFCGSCHAPDVPEPGCFNNTLCHGADGDDSDSDLDDSDSDSDSDELDDSDSDDLDDSDSDEAEEAGGEEAV